MTAPTPRLNVEGLPGGGDPHPPDPKYGWNTCPTPSEAHFGDTWTCPDCDRTYFAGEEGDEGDHGAFTWMLDPTADQPVFEAPR